MTSLRNHSALAVLSFAATLGVMFVPAAALAGGDLSTVQNQITTLETAILNIIRVAAIIAAGVIGYQWMTGSHEARSRTEKWLIGVVVIFASTFILSQFQW